MNGIFKVFTAFEASRFDLNQEDINQPAKVRVNLRNNNLYFNASYKGNFANNWQLFSGLSYGYIQNNTNLDNNKGANAEKATHFKVKFTKKLFDRLKLNFGSDYINTKFDEKANTTFKSGYESNNAAVYTEADLFFSKKFAAKIGVRTSTIDYINENTISPRVSLAYKISKNSQFAFAYGNFEQTPRKEYLKYFDDFETDKAVHYILNYQYVKENSTLRAEVYFKGYTDLVKYGTNGLQFNSQFTNNGQGYAKRLDIFLRDGNSIKNLEYWVSYSFIDTKRDYQNFSAEVTPSFVAANSASVVTKYWISNWKSQVGFTYQFASERPYNNPNETVFMNGKTTAFNNLSFNWAYLLTQQKILYFSVSNIMGTQNIFGYNYSNT